jgi:hypothetical protein
MALDLYTRISNLEAVVFPGDIPVRGHVVNITTPGPASITLLPELLIILSAPGPVQLSLPLPTLAQNNWRVCILSQNAQANKLTTGTNGIVFNNGISNVYIDSMSDQGAIGQFLLLVASDGVWKPGAQRFGYSEMGWS